ncbi:MAG: hypothetical protein AAGK97_11660 [Bacteroidota bacterium]
MPKTIFFYIILLTLLNSRIQAQSPLPTYMQSIQGYIITPLPKEYIQQAAQSTAIFEELKPYANDNNKRVRSEAYSLAANIGKRSEISNVRETAIEFILDGALKEKDSGLIGRYFNSLKKFERKDFSRKAKSGLINMIDKKTPHLKTLFMLIGFLDLKEGEAAMNAVETKSKSIVQARNLALVRMGNKEKLEQMINNISKMALNDDFIYNIMPMLVYVRKKQSFDLLIDRLQNESKNCTPADAETDGQVTCGYRLMEGIAPYINDFPLELDISGDIVTRNYQKALASARKWTSKNKKKYSLNEEIF